MSVYSKIIADWLNGIRREDTIKEVVKFGDTPILLDEIRKKVQNTSSSSGLAALMELFSVVLKTAANTYRMPGPVNGDDTDGDLGKDTSDFVRRAASKLMDPVEAEEMLNIGMEQLPEAVKLGIMKYVAQEHPDLTVKERHTRLLQTMENEYNQAIRRALRVLRTAGIAPEDAEKAVDDLIAAVPENANVSKINEFAQAIAEAGFTERAQHFLEQWLSKQGLSNQDKAMLFVGMGNVNLANDPALAAAYYGKALQLDQGNISAMVGMARVHRAGERWDEAMGLLRKAIEMAAGKPEEPEVLIGLVEVLEGMGRWEQAEMYVKRVRFLDPDNKHVLMFYAKYYEFKQDWEKLCSTLQTLLNAENNPVERLRIIRRLAGIAMDKMDNQERALEFLKKLVDMDPMDRDALERLVAIYEATGRWRGLVSLYSEQVKRLPESENPRKVEFLKRIVDIYEDEHKLNKPEMALAAYGKIASLDPGDTEVLGKLKEAHRRNKNWSALVMVLKQERKVTKDRQKRVEICREIAQIGLEKLSNEGLALQCLEEIQEIVPGDVEVLERLLPIYEHKRKYEKLIDVVKRLLPVSDVERRKKLLYQAAVTLKEKLGKPDEALTYYEELYKVEPSGEISNILHRMYAQLGKWDVFARFLETELAGDMPDQRKIKLLIKLGTLKMDRLNDIAGAGRIFEMALELQPDNTDVRDRLKDIYLARNDFEHLKDMFRRTGRLRDYVNALAEHEDKVQGTDIKVRIALEIAETCEQDLGDTKTAMRYYERAFSMRPELTEAGMKLAEYYVKTKDHEQAIKVLSGLLERPEDFRDAPELRTNLLLKAAAIYTKELDAPSKAIPLLKEVLQVVPNHPDATGLLEEIAFQQKDFRLLESIRRHNTVEQPVPDVTTREDTEKQPQQDTAQDTPPDVEQEEATVSTGQDSNMKRFYELFDRGMDLYFDKKYNEALSVWQEAARLNPEDKTVQVNIRRIEQILSELS